MSDTTKDAVPVDECVEWTGSRNKDGYGTVKRCGKFFLAHRFTYCQHNNISIESIKDLVVRHSCDNPPCVNPKHLLIGTHADNTRDKVARNRHPKGEKNGQAKLTAAQVAEIRSVYVRGSKEFGAPALAKKFCVSQSAINSIILRRNWVSLTLSTGDQS